MIQRRTVAEQREVADFHRRADRFHQLAAAGPLGQGSLLIALNPLRHQHIHLTTHQRSEQGRGVAEAHQVDALVAGGWAPVVLKGKQRLLLGGFAGQPVGACAHEALRQGTPLVLAIGAGRERREVDRAEQSRQGAVGPLQLQLQFVRAARPHSRDAIVEQIAHLPEGAEALQAEHHRRGIEAGAVVKQHASPQGNASRESVGTQLGQLCGQARLQLALGIGGVEGIADRAEQLHAREGGDIHRIHRGHRAVGGHHQLIGWMTGLTAREQCQSRHQRRQG